MGRGSKTSLQDPGPSGAAANLRTGLAAAPVHECAAEPHPAEAPTENIQSECVKSTINTEMWVADDRVDPGEEQSCNTSQAYHTLTGDLNGLSDGKRQHASSGCSGEGDHGHGVPTPARDKGTTS